MTLTTLLTYIAFAAMALTFIVALYKKDHKSWFMTFLQNFTGILFLVSGWVKAVDPMGTAFKMEQYFGEFESTFEATWFAFMAPVFPVLSKFAIAFSVLMIIYEMILGIMLILGHRSKLTSWAFMILVVFFTVLTGFTFLTGYVPSDANFFNFTEWGPYVETNMKVTDCGCFGDFIKLEPKTSFLKDIVLLFPAFFFVFKHKDMHQLFTEKTRNIIVGLATVGLIFYCLNNYVWNLPHADFRPFSIGTDVAAKKLAEEEAMGSVQVIAWRLKEKASGKVVELPRDIYMKEFKNYPKESWEVVEQITSKPPIEATKISDFEFLDEDGHSVSEDLLVDEDASLMIVCYKLYGDKYDKEITVMDSVFRADTAQIVGSDVTVITQTLERVDERKEMIEEYHWEPEYLERFTGNLKTFIEAAEAVGVKPFVVAGGASHSKLESIKKASGLNIPFYEADDILLKTIVRSNPGIVLFKKGKILDKWHRKKLPPFEKVQSEHNL